MPTKWGVLSTGGIANDFSLALSKTDGAVLHACASRSQSSADAFAATHGFSVWFSAARRGSPYVGEGGSGVKVDQETERIINRGLKYLAKYQSPNGSWQGRNEKERHYPIAMTAYALMAFQAAGHLPGEGEFGREVTLGVQYLLNSVSPEGLIGDKNNGQYMYFHGVSSIAHSSISMHPPSPSASSM